MDDVIARMTHLGMAPDLAVLAAETWTHIGMVHDWRNHVPDKVRAVWRELDDQARAAVWCTASMHAFTEEWD